MLGSNASAVLNKDLLWFVHSISTANSRLCRAGRTKCIEWFWILNMRFVRRYGYMTGVSQRFIALRAVIMDQLLLRRHNEMQKSFGGFHLKPPVTSKKLHWTSLGFNSYGDPISPFLDQAQVFKKLETACCVTFSDRVNSFRLWHKFSLSNGPNSVYLITLSHTSLCRSSTLKSPLLKRRIHSSHAF